jgi:hypothetical protein
MTNNPNLMNLSLMFKTASHVRCHALARYQTVMVSGAFASVPCSWTLLSLPLQYSTKLREYSAQYKMFPLVRADQVPQRTTARPQE